MDAPWPQGAAAVRWNRIASSLTKFLQYYYFYRYYDTLQKNESNGLLTWRER